MDVPSGFCDGFRRAAASRQLEPKARGQEGARTEEQHSENRDRLVPDDKGRSERTKTFLLF
jgi:hypothetical protein